MNYGLLWTLKSSRGLLLLIEDHYGFPQIMDPRGLTWIIIDQYGLAWISGAVDDHTLSILKGHLGRSLAMSKWPRGMAQVWRMPGWSGDKHG